MKFEYSPDEIPPKVVDVLKRFSLHFRKDGSLEENGIVFDSIIPKIKASVVENYSYYVGVTSISLEKSKSWQSPGSGYRSRRRTGTLEAE
jgi:hypothetical protein